MKTFLAHKASQLERNFKVLPLTHQACRDSTLSGGKGSNLAKLTGLQSTVRCKTVIYIDNNLVLRTRWDCYNSRGIPRASYTEFVFEGINRNG